MQKIGMEDLEDLNSVEMSNERLLRLEASEIFSLRKVITCMWRLETDLDVANGSNSSNGSEFDERQLNLSAPLPSTLETLRHILERQVALNELRYALVVFARPVVLFLALLLELLALVVLVRLTCARRRHQLTCTESPTSTYLYLVLHVAACTIEDALFHAPEWLAFAFGVRHPATAHRLLCSFWWLGFKMIHAFPLWILLPVSYRAVLVVRSAISSSSNTHYCEALTQSEPQARRNQRTEVTNVRRQYPRRSGAVDSGERWTGPPAVETDGSEAVGATLAALLSTAALVCLNIHTFWSHATGLLKLPLRSESVPFELVEFRLCHIPARTGWFFQRVWPRVEGTLSKLAPAVLLLPLALYGICAFCFSRHRRASDINHIPLSTIPTAAVSTLSAIHSPDISPIISPVVRRVAIFRERLREENAIEPAATPREASESTFLQQDAHLKCSASKESCEQLRLVLLLALVTSVVALQEMAAELLAAMGPDHTKYSTREWLLALLASHSLSLLAQCATLPLCIALSTRFRQHFCALLCFCVRRDYSNRQRESLSSSNMPHGSYEN